MPKRIAKRKRINGYRNEVKSKFKFTFISSIFIIILFTSLFGIIFNLKNKQTIIPYAASTKYLNLLKDGDFESTNISSTIKSLVFSQTISSGWTRIKRTPTSQISFSYDSQDKISGTQSQKISSADAGEGISQTVIPPRGVPFVYSAYVKVLQGSVSVGIGSHKRTLTNTQWQKVNMLSSGSSVSDKLEVSITSGTSYSTFLVDQVELRELDMSINAGKMLEEHFDSNSTPRALSTSSDISLNSIKIQPESVSSGVSQTIPVTIGISWQVIANHCDESTSDTVINPLTNRCKLVEDLAIRDLNIMRQKFEGTLKTFTFSGFDEPWDQTIEQGCGRATGGQTLSKMECNHNKDTIYISALYVKDVDSSGGEAAFWITSIRYVAPSRFNNGNLDSWKNPRSEWIPQKTVTHEIGHLFGQEHTPWVPDDQNSVLPGIGYPWHGDMYYDMDFNLEDKNSSSRQWAMKITQNAKIPLSDDMYPWGRIPKKILIDVLDTNNEYKLNSVSKVKMYYSTDKMGSNSPIYGEQNIYSESIQDINVNSSGQIEIEGNLFSKHSIYLFLIEAQNKNCFFWLDITQVNIAYFNGDTDLALFSKSCISLPSPPSPTSIFSVKK